MSGTRLGSKQISDLRGDKAPEQGRTAVSGGLAPEPQVRMLRRVHRAGASPGTGCPSGCCHARGWNWCESVCVIENKGTLLS